MAVKPEAQTRPLYEIAMEIRATWPTLDTAGFAAVPYVKAMGDLDEITSPYYAESAEAMVRYFLGNAGSWRGEDARRIKAELRAMLG